MERPVHFEIQAEEPLRCAKFYTEVFGWLIEQWGEQKYWMCYTNGKKTAPMEKIDEPGINGGILPRMGTRPADGASVNAYVCTMAVENYDRAHEKILAAGGIVALPKFALAGMAWQGYYKDTEGNIFGIHQPDESAR